MNTKLIMTGISMFLIGAVLTAAAILWTPKAEADDGSSRIGYVDLERTLYETPAGKRASAAFDRTRQSKQGELDKKQKDLQQAAAALDKEAAVLKPDVLKSKKEALEKQFVELQQVYVQLERQLAEERTKLISDMLKKAGPIIKDLAQQDGYTMIVDRSAILWAEPADDLTHKLNSRMK